MLKNEDARLEALDKGEMHYLPSAPCNNGHTTERYTSSGACVACAKIYRKTTRRLAKNLRSMSKNSEVQKKAKKLGLEFFLPVSPCVNGHMTKRFAKDGACKECRQAKAKKAYEKKVRKNGLRGPHRTPRQKETDLLQQENFDELFDFQESLRNG